MGILQKAIDCKNVRGGQCGRIKCNNISLNFWWITQPFTSLRCTRIHCTGNCFAIAQDCNASLSPTPAIASDRWPNILPQCTIHDPNAQSECTIQMHVPNAWTHQAAFFPWTTHSLTPHWKNLVFFTAALQWVIVTNIIYLKKKKNLRLYWIELNCGYIATASNLVAALYLFTNPLLLVRCASTLLTTSCAGDLCFKISIFRKCILWKGIFW